MINRRRFLQAGAATAAMLAWPIRMFPFSQSPTGIRKFVIDLPGLGPTHPNSLGNFIPVLTPNTKLVRGTDVYTVEAVDFTQKVHDDIANETRFWGYAAPGGAQKYLGGVIVATKGTPVQLRITNRLPGLHILPVDPTLIDPVVAAETGERQDRIAVHLHGGFVFWDSDGGPFSWFANPDNSEKSGPVEGPSFINGGASGEAVYNYPNDQSARTIWYHDHAYGLTRTNVYAGLASAYLITDASETALIDSEFIPGKGVAVVDGGLGIPLILQDKTFWIATGGDQGYNKVPPAGAQEGDLWYPHKYEGALDPPGTDLPDMGLPPTTTLTARWGANPVGKFPPVSSVPEFFSDTIVVNGAPYPTFNVKAQRYRFRFVNASQARFYNLQLYVADPNNPDGITLVEDLTPGLLDNNDNLIVKPDPTKNPPGPAFIQIGNECGFLPMPAVFSSDPNGLINRNKNQIITYNLGPLARIRGWHHKADQRLSNPQNDPRVGNVDLHNLLMTPAERPDVIIDFRDPAWKTGTEFILYNDAPAPFPGGDIRNDYYVSPSAHDLTPIGGAPPTQSGHGPDTRVLMKFILIDDTPSPEPNFATTVSDLRGPNGLPKAFAENGQPTQPLNGKLFTKTLNEDNDEFGRLRQLLGVVPLPAVQTYLDFPTEVALKGEVQMWDIFNLTADTHPMHFHLVNVEVKSRRAYAFHTSDGSPVIPLVATGPELPIDDNERGWKETVRVNPGEVTRVAMQFDLPSGTAPANSKRLLASYGIKGAEYVWHCHILEHEEHDMMHALVVI